MTNLECPYCRKAFSVEVRAGIPAREPYGSAPGPGMRRRRALDALAVGLMLMGVALAAVLEGYLSWQEFAIACLAVPSAALISWPMFRVLRLLWMNALRRRTGRERPDEQEYHRV
jgi:hypothetical protein